MNELKMSEILINGYRKGGVPGAAVSLMTKSLESEIRGQVRSATKPLTDPSSHSHKDHIVKVANNIWASRYSLRGSMPRSAKKNIIMSNVRTIRQGQFGALRKVSHKGMPVQVHA